VAHADETPVKLPAPGKGKTRKAHVWVDRTTSFVAQRTVRYDFSVSRGGDDARRVLQGFDGTWVCDDFSGCHALQSQGVRAALRMAQARRKPFEAHPFTGSPIAGHAVALMARPCEVERKPRELRPEARRLWRRRHAKPVAEAVHAWLSERRLQARQR
jgi:transposase